MSEVQQQEIGREEEKQVGRTLIAAGKERRYRERPRQVNVCPADDSGHVRKKTASRILWAGLERQGETRTSVDSQVHRTRIGAFQSWGGSGLGGSELAALLHTAERHYSLPMAIPPCR